MFDFVVSLCTVLQYQRGLLNADTGRLAVDSAMPQYTEWQPNSVVKHEKIALWWTPNLTLLYL